MQQMLLNTHQDGSLDAEGRTWLSAKQRQTGGLKEWSIFINRDLTRGSQASI
jgi:hypothetical protein